MSERHIHEWTKTDSATGITAWACTGCTETSATCGTCGGPSGTSLLLCEACRERTARVLDDIAHALSMWEPEPRSLVKSPGNMALAPQPSSGENVGLRTPDDIEGKLWGWCARWSEFTAPENIGWLGYLRGHLIWGAQNPDESDWSAFLADIRRLRTAARRIAGLLPRFMPEPCAICGGPVIQDRADREWNPLTGQLPDTVRCLRCGRAWDDPILWRFANRQHIVSAPDEHPDALVTLDQARMVWPAVPTSTLWMWIKRDRDARQRSIDEAIVWNEAWNEYENAPGDAAIERDEPPALIERMIPERGEREGSALYRVGDIQSAVDRWLDDTRRGPRARIADGVA